MIKRNWLWLIFIIGSIMMTSCGRESFGEKENSYGTEISGETEIFNETEISCELETSVAEENMIKDNFTEPVRIAILDSGISSRVIASENLDEGVNYIKPLDGTEDTIGHGTAVASIIVGSESAGLEGICPRAILVPLVYCAEDYLGRTVNADAITIGEMIYEAVDTFDCDIINISAASAKDDKYLKEAVKYAIEQGVIVIACAGNTNLTTPENVYYPGVYEDVICVGAVNEEGVVSDFSQRGAYLDFTAPGEEILAADMDGEAVYMTGTSFATAYVTGLVANIFIENPDLKQTQTSEQIQEMVLEILKEYADDVNEDGWDAAYGWGVLGFIAM